jgi:hypothetical protein
MQDVIFHQCPEGRLTWPFEYFDKTSLIDKGQSCVTTPTALSRVSAANNVLARLSVTGAIDCVIEGLCRDGKMFNQNRGNR